MLQSFSLTRLFVRAGLAQFLPSVRRLVDGGTPYLRYYSDRVLTLPHAKLLEVAGLLEPPAPDVIDLTHGAPRFDLLPSGTTRLPMDRRGWPPCTGIPELRAAVAEKLRLEDRLAVNPAEEVLITSGASGAFQVALDTFVNPGDRVVLLDPCSPLHYFALRQRGARIHWLPTWTEEGRLRFALDRLARALRRARLIVITSPSNPTGGVIAPEDLEQIAWWADRQDALIVSDETFERFHYEGDRLSIATLARAQRRTLTLGSMSKGYALASARVGWLAGYRHLLRPAALSAGVQSHMVPTLSQQVALSALRQEADAFEAIREQFDARRRYSVDRLGSADLKASWPGGAFFLWVPVWQLGLSGGDFAARLLKANRVLVTPGHVFGPSGTGYIRISYAGEDGRLREGLNRLGDFVHGLNGAPVAQVRRLAA